MNYQDAVQIAAMVKKMFPELSCTLDPNNDRTSGYIDIQDTNRIHIAGAQWHPDAVRNGVTSRDHLYLAAPFDVFPGIRANTVDSVMKRLVPLLALPMSLPGEPQREFQPNPGERPYAEAGYRYFDPERP